MVRPVRLQLSRRKGFDLQALSQATNGLPAASVARPSKWGNPWRKGINRCSGRGLDFRCEPVQDNQTAVAFFREMLDHHDRAYPHDSEIASRLHGKNLACWCKPGAPCHADVLLEIANAPTEAPTG